MIAAFFAWVGIGLAASLAAMTWPMWRGPVGVFINMASSVAGAVLVALLGLGMGWYRADNTSFSYFLAAVGAFVGLGIVHGMFYVADRREHEERAGHGAGEHREHGRMKRA